MAKYKTKGITFDEDEENETNFGDWTNFRLEVTEEPMYNTGLLSRDGSPLFRVKDPIGFRF